MKKNNLMKVTTRRNKTKNPFSIYSGCAYGRVLSLLVYLLSVEADPSPIPGLAFCSLPYACWHRTKMHLSKELISLHQGCLSTVQTQHSKLTRGPKSWQNTVRESTKWEGLKARKNVIRLQTHSEWTEWTSKKGDCQGTSDVN